jgi:hypothetical protein
MIKMKRKRRSKEVIVAFGIGLPRRLIGIIPPIKLEEEKEFIRKEVREKILKRR